MVVGQVSFLSFFFSFLVSFFSPSFSLESFVPYTPSYSLPLPPPSRLFPPPSTLVVLKIQVFSILVEICGPSFQHPVRRRGQREERDRERQETCKEVL